MYMHFYIAKIPLSDFTFSKGKEYVYILVFWTGFDKIR